MERLLAWLSQFSTGEFVVWGVIAALTARSIGGPIGICVGLTLGMVVVSTIGNEIDYHRWMQGDEEEPD